MEHQPQTAADPPTGLQPTHRPPTTDHRPTDRSINNPPTTLHRQVLYQPTDHRLTDHRLNKTHEIFQNSFNPCTCNYYILRLLLIICQQFFLLNLSFGIVYCIMHINLSLFERVDLKTISSFN